MNHMKNNIFSVVMALIITRGAVAAFSKTTKKSAESFGNYSRACRGEARDDL